MLHLGFGSLWFQTFTAGWEPIPTDKGEAPHCSPVLCLPQRFSPGLPVPPQCLRCSGRGVVQLWALTLS